MFDFDAQRVLVNVRQATTEDLLDRITVNRAGMEDEAIAVIESELRSRGVSNADIDAHAHRRQQEVVPSAAGTAQTCSYCREPAVAQGWSWHRLWRVMPIFPRFVHYCATHRPA
jgi:hypothetical protein